jgi:hypothetical protein
MFDDVAEAATLETADVVIATSSVVVPPAATNSFTYKLAALLAAGAIAGSALVAGPLSYFGSDEPVSAEAAEPANRPVVAETPKAATQVADPTPDPFGVEIPPATEVETPSEPAADEARETEETPAKEEVVATTPAAPSPPSETAPVVTPAIAADAPPNAEEPKPKLIIDPLDIDPEGLDISTLYAGAQKDPLVESHLPASGEKPAIANPASTNSSDAGELRPANADKAVRRPTGDPIGAPADATPLLARKIPAFKFNKLPLSHVLDLSTQMSGLPVSISPDQLRMAGVSAGTAVTVDAKDATIENILSTALKPLRLQPVVDREHIHLKRIGEPKRRQVSYAIDDLAAVGAGVEKWAQWIQELVAPETWQTRGGNGVLAIESHKLRIDQSESIQYEILLLLERCRVARGLSTRSKYPSSLISPQPAHAAAAERLKAPATFTFTQYTPLREIFRYWQQELDVALLIDWPAISAERLWPETRIACSAANQPWGEAMDSVLEPLGLSWRAVDGRTIQITTREKVRCEPQVEIYRVASGASGEQLFAKITELAAANEPASAPAMAYDAASQLLLVRQPAAVQRQIVAAMSAALELSSPANAAR